VLALSGVPARALAVRFEPIGLEAALRKAAEQDRLVLVDVFARWCGPCQQLDRESFVHPDVTAETDAHFVALKIDGEAGDGPAVMRRYHVVGFPTLLVLRPDGTELDRVFGFQAGPDLAGTLRGYREGQGTLAERLAESRARPEDLELVTEVALRSIVRGDMKTARPLVARVTRADADNRRGLASKVLFHVARYHHLRGDENYRAALGAFADLARRYPTSEEASGGAFAIDTAKALHRLRRDPEAMAALERYVGQGPDDVDRYNTVAFFLYRESWALPRGEGFARHGLAVDPTNASLWDTLAEILAARGKLEEAVSAAERAQLLDPQAPYYGLQVTRFRGMLAEAPPRRP